MKSALSFFSIFVFTALSAAADEPIHHRFLCCDYAGNRVAIVSAKGEIEWEFPATVPMDCWLLPNGNVLICHHPGAMEVTPDKKIVWEYKAPKGAECDACQPLADGRVMVAETFMSRLVEVDRNGAVVKEIKIDSHPKVGSHQFRGTRKTADGHYIVCLMDEKKIVELDGDGKVVKETPLEGHNHAALKLANGNMLVTLFDKTKVVEYDPAMKAVWEVGENDLSNNKLLLPAGCQRLANGNTIICNFSFKSTQPLVIEVTPDKKVVWEFSDHEHFKTVNEIQIIDTPAHVIKGEAVR
jgi:hypothetical protein